MAAKKKETSEIEILRIKQGEVNFCIRGTTPLICNTLNQKVLRELVYPSGPKSRADKKNTLKHHPVEEFRRSMRLRDEGSTAIRIPAAAFKGAIASAALDIPGSSKAQVGRLVTVVGDMVEIYGTPTLYMTNVRMKDIARTPDVRTRAAIKDWACYLTVRYVSPTVSEVAVANLLAGAGVIIGVGDGRPEKGKMSFGQFELVDQDDEEFQRIVKTGGRKAQMTAIETPVPYDEISKELLEWWLEEIERRK